MKSHTAVLSLLLLAPSLARADDTARCDEKRAYVADIRMRLADAVARREDWVKAHCKLVFNAKGKSRAVGRHWECDGKFFGNEGTLIQSKEELELESYLANALARVTVCCGENRPPNWCSIPD